MQLYCDRISGMYTLDTGEGVEFLGGITHALVVLQRNYDLTASQAREAVLRAMFNGGEAVPINDVKKMAKLIRKNEGTNQLEYSSWVNRSLTVVFSRFYYKHGA